jgi:hypothetical protein
MKKRQRLLPAALVAVGVLLGHTLASRTFGMADELDRTTFPVAEQPLRTQRFFVYSSYAWLPSGQKINLYLYVLKLIIL